MNYVSKNLSDEDLLKYSKGKVYHEGDIILRGTSPSTVSGGLYDKRIFGSERYCECGISFSAGHVCPVCATSIESPNKLKYRFGHIELKYPYVSPFQLPTIVKLILEVFGVDFPFKLPSNVSIRSFLILMNSLEFKLNVSTEETSFVSQGLTHLNAEISEATEDSELSSIGLTGVLNLLDPLDRSPNQDQLFKSLHKVILVSPAIRRNYSITTIQGKNLVSIPQATIDYQCIVYVNNHIDKILGAGSSTEEKMAKITGFQLMIAALLNGSQLVASSKSSFVRSSASTTAFKSGRATIISDNSLKVTEIGIPWKKLYHSVQSDVRKKLASRGVSDIEIQYRDHTPVAEECFQEVIADSSALLIRNPSLHKYNLTAFKPKAIDSETIHLPPLVCNSFNADFDGDQMAYFICTDPIKASEMMDVMSAEGHWYYTKNKKSAYTPNREILQGLGEATRFPYTELSDNYPSYTLDKASEEFELGKLNVSALITINSKVTTYGREYISNILGVELDSLIGYDNISTKNIAQIMTFIYEKDGPELLNKLEKFSVEVLKRIGVTTLTLSDLYVDSNAYGKKFMEIIESDLSPTDKDFQLTKELSNVLGLMINDLPVPDIKQKIKDSNRYKMEQLTSLIGPTIIHNADGSMEVELTSHADGLGTKAYVEECINNRIIWGYKQALVSVGGYNARQMSVIAKAIQFEPTPNTKEIDPIYLPNITPEDKEFLKNREVIGESPIPGYVQVRSSIFNGEALVYSNEIDSSIYKTASGNLRAFNIGIDMMTSFSEPVTQSALGLKHGGREYNYTEESYRVKSPCKIIGKEGSFIIVNENGNELKYPVPASSEVTTKSVLDKGEILYSSTAKEHVTAPLAKVSKFIDSITMIDQLKDAILSDCYALGEGTIHYDISAMKVNIGGISHNYNPKDIYYYPEGAMIRKFTRISSGTLDIRYASSILKDDRLTFIIFRKQIHKLVPSLNLDIAEVLYKAIFKNGNSVRKTLMKNTNLLDSLYKGSPKGGRAVLKDFINKDMQLFDESDLIYQLIFQDGLKPQET